MRQRSIYIIECIENNCAYIGITDNVIRRSLNHFTWLRSGIHRNKALQLDYNTYGEDKFHTAVLFHNADKQLEKQTIIQYSKSRVLYNIHYNEYNRKATKKTDTEKHYVGVFLDKPIYEKFLQIANINCRPVSGELRALIMAAVRKK